MRPWKTGIRLPQAQPEPPTALKGQERVVIPMQWGETALVRVGERVRLGQRIADGTGDMVPLHASISGHIAAVAPRTCADGKRYPAIVIENDGEERLDPSVRSRALLDEFSDELLLGLLFESGIRLPDGTPLASAVADAGPGLKTLIISAMDPEPWLYAEDAALAFDTEAALSGIRVLERLSHPETVVIAAGAHQKTAIGAVARWTGRRLRLAVMPDVYPTCHPQRLAELIGNVEAGQSCRTAGVLVLPVSAAAACGHAAYEGMPVTTQTVGVDWGTGRALFTAPVGTPVSAVLKAAGCDESNVILGGPMTGARLENLSVPLTKGMSGLTVLTESPAADKTACIRCGRCAAVCPVGLKPYLCQTRRAAQSFSACIRCGACQYSCPAGLPLMQSLNRRHKEVAGIG